VFVAFRIAGTFYQLGNRSGRLPESAILPRSTITLHGHAFPARWRVPDPSFRYADPVAGVRRLDGWLRGYRTDMGRWTEFYRSPDARRISQSGSAFARWAHQQVRSTGAIADLGCGNGRDAVYFAKRGRPVVAYEFSRAARGTARRRIASKGHGIDVRLLMLGELRSVLLAGRRARPDPAPPLRAAAARLPRRAGPRQPVAAVPDGAAARRLAAAGVQRRDRRAGPRARPRAGRPGPAPRRRRRTP